MSAPNNPETTTYYLAGIFREVLPCEWIESMQAIAEVYSDVLDLRDPPYRLPLLITRELMGVEEQAGESEDVMRDTIEAHAPPSFFRNLDVSTTGRIEPYPAHSSQLVGMILARNMLDVDRIHCGNRIKWIGRNPTHNPMSYYIRFGHLIGTAIDEHENARTALTFKFPTTVTFGPVQIEVLEKPQAEAQKEAPGSET